MRDERTTPPALRLPALLLIALVVAWFGASYRFALGGAQPEWARPWPWAWWFANWEMFTMIDDYAAIVRAEALVDGEWRRVDLEALFPTRWESGPRYARSAFYNSPPFMAVLADSTCGRLPTRPTKVRFHRVSWKKTLGVSNRKPPKDAQKKLLLEWSCAREVERPGGVRF